METMAATASMHFPHEPANYDEISMQQSMIFTDSLKDLKNLSKQLYSAAEYFELSYSNGGQKQIVVNTLKDYAIKALINTVDHLGTVSYKVNDLMNEKVDDLTGTELRLCYVEQRFRTCQNFIDREGLSQQSLVINTPKYHKRYIIPVGETEYVDAFSTKLKYQGCSLDDRDDWRHFRKAIRAAVKETPTVVRKRSLSPKLSHQRGRNFSFSYSILTDSGLFRAISLYFVVLEVNVIMTALMKTEKGAVSPNRFPLLRTGSLSSKPAMLKSWNPATPNYGRPTTPTSTFARQLHVSEFRRSVSMQVRGGKESLKDDEKNASKSKRLLKALLTRRKSKKDDTLFTYLDEY